MNNLINLIIFHLEENHRKIFLFGVSGFAIFVISLVTIFTLGIHEKYLDLAVTFINLFLISCSLWLLKYAMMLIKRSIKEAEYVIRKLLLKVFACFFIVGAATGTYFLAKGVLDALIQAIYS